MIAAATGFAGLDAILAHLPAAMVFAVTLVVLLASISVALLVALRRKRRKDAQEIILHLEEMRSGRARTRLDLDPRSPFAPIAESANRLGQDLGVRWSRAETANEAFTALQESARGYAVIATDSDGDLRALSPGAVPLFGWDEDAVVGRNVAMLFDEASWKELLPKLARKSLRERGVETRSTMIRQDGSRFHARLVVRILRGHGDDPSGFLLVVQDVSEQVRVEADLRAAESRSRGILESLPGGVALVQSGRLVYANPVARTLLDLKEAEVSGFVLRERIATSHVLLVQDALSRLESGAGSATAEESVPVLDAEGRAGREIRLVGIAQAHDGRPSVLLLLRDETAERRVVRTLAAEEARLDAVLDAWNDAVLFVEDESGGPRVRVANRAFLSLFGLSRAEISGLAEGDLIAVLRKQGPEGAAAAACLASASSGPAKESVVTEGRELALWARPLGDARTASHGRMMAARDVTDDRAREHAQGAEADTWKRRHEATVASYAKLRALHDELDVRRQDAERLSGELRTLDRMKSDLLANVSHELQTPLVSIRGYTEMILKGRLGTINEEQKKGLTLSLKNIDRLIAMIDNLLAFARMDRESGKLTLTSFPVAGVVDEALAVLAPKIQAKGLQALKKIDDPTLIIRADREKILQVFLNLVSNAVKFNREQGSIEIWARRGKPGFALVQIRDTGVGIAKSDLEKVFDRFYRVDAGAAQPKEGTGIGLAIVRNILRQHGCVIHATSEPGQGTVLSFTLPLAEERAPSEEVPQPEPASAEPPREAPPAPEIPTPRRDETARRGLRIIRRG